MHRTFEWRRESRSCASRHQLPEPGPPLTSSRAVLFVPAFTMRVFPSVSFCDLGDGQGSGYQRSVELLN